MDPFNNILRPIPNALSLFGKSSLFSSLDLTARYTQSAEGENLIDLTGNSVDIPYISGAGLDQLFDFSVLNDDRFNKNARLGNGFALPEYFDWPFPVQIYYDENNPFHYKLSDFHRRFWEDQNIINSNYAFAKLTYSEGILQGVNEILIYAEGKTGSNLSALKKYIKILPDFKGDELVINGSFNEDIGWDKYGSTTIDSGKAIINIGAGMLGVRNIAQSYILQGNTYAWEFTISNYQSGNIALIGTVFGYKSLNGIFSGVSKTPYPDRTAELYTSNGFVGSVDNISVKNYYQNYYINEIM